MQPKLNEYPTIIQGGMGAGVSSWRLARAVSTLGQLGVVSGTALDQIFARRLQDGDPGGHMRHALDHFVFPRMAERVWESYYIPGGKPERTSYQTLPMQAQNPPRDFTERCIVANFVEVFLARQGHDHMVGINYLEKVQIPHLPSIYGAMLAGVGVVLMGAGVPVKIPGALDRLARHDLATYNLSVAGAQDGDDTTMTFDPHEWMECELPSLSRPKFFAIISSNTLADSMCKRANGRIDGFVVERPSAGGHNAPPRGKLTLDDTGEAVYGERDNVDLSKMRNLGLPFWLAGGCATLEGLREAIAAGAIGVQVGTAFAFCVESGLRDDYKRALLAKVVTDQAKVSTDTLASPTGFPFKVAQLEGSMSEPAIYAARPRICDLGYLREAYRTADGEIAYRCAAEPVTLYIAKGGKSEKTVGKKCLCNSLLATIGHPQVRNGNLTEEGLVTSGNDLIGLARFLPSEGLAYSAADVVRQLLS